MSEPASVFVWLGSRTPEKIRWPSLVMESHATFQSAAVYFDMETQTTRQTSRTEFAWPEFCACFVYRALTAFSSIFLAPPWRKDLATIYQKLIKLDPLLVGALDE